MFELEKKGEKRRKRGLPQKYVLPGGRLVVRARGEGRRRGVGRLPEPGGTWDVGLGHWSSTVGACYSLVSPGQSVP
jgi:hypothetical protein